MIKNHEREGTRMKKKLFFGLLAIVMVTIFVLFPKGVPAQAPKPITIKALTPLPITAISNQPFSLFLDMVKKRSQGRLIIDWRGGPEIIKASDQPEALKTGAIDMILWAAFGYLKSHVACAEAEGLSDYAAWEERKTGAFDLWSEILKKNLNAKYLGKAWSLSPFTIYTRKPISKIEDFKGLKLRVMPLYIPFIKALGAAPITLPLTEIYTALERGVVDGFMFLDYGITGFGVQEVVKHKIYPPVFQQETATLINMDVWNKIPKDLQDLLMDVFVDFEYVSAAYLLQLKNDEWRICEKAGMNIINLPPEDAKKFRKIAYDATWEVVIKDSPDLGPKLRELLTKK
jgi:TRAP-type C4-dicarboxylate transport system substrate-binding protein